MLNDHLQAEHRTLQDILANFTVRLLSHFGKTFHTLHQCASWPHVRYTLKIMIFFPYPLSMTWFRSAMPSLTIMVIWHQADAVRAFLNEKFQSWVLSQRTANPRLAHSTDFNHLDLLVQCMKSFAEGYSQETISRVSKNVLKPASNALPGGYHFQHFLYRHLQVFPFVFRLIYVIKN